MRSISNADTLLCGVSLRRMLAYDGIKEITSHNGELHINIEMCSYTFLCEGCVCEVSQATLTSGST
jgi:hypothetical protein